jgi:hypothetical protein
VSGIGVKQNKELKMSKAGDFKDTDAGRRLIAMSKAEFEEAGLEKYRILAMVHGMLLMSSPFGDEMPDGEIPEEARASGTITGGLIWKRNSGCSVPPALLEHDWSELSFKQLTCGHRTG